MGDKETAVPFTLIRQSKSASPGYVLNVDKAKLSKASFFDPKSYPDYNDPTWNNQNYSYYGVNPYWTTPATY